MTLEIVPYDEGWPRTFEEESRSIRAVLGAIAVRVEHNGSTAVPGLAAKPIIDIQVSVHDLGAMDAYREPLQTLGYVHLPHPDDSWSVFLHKPGQWPHTYHIHVVEAGGDEERRTLAFRDYLRAHPPVAQEYEALKRALAPKFDAASFDSRQAYADAKGEFIEEAIKKALAEGYPRGFFFPDV